MESIVVSSLLTGALTIQCIVYGQQVTRKPLQILIMLQFLLITARGYTVVLLSAFPGIDCAATSIIGLIFYQLWVVILQMVLFLRGWAFAVTPLSRNVFSGVCGLLFLLQWGFRFFSVANTVVVSRPGEFCRTTQVGLATSLPNFTLLIITYFILLAPFLYRALTTYMDARNQSPEAVKWLQSSIINMVIIVCILIIEFFARFVAPAIPNMHFGILFSVINFIEPNLILFLVYDLKRTMTTSKKGTVATSGTHSKSTAL
jgi:hypothetical protein